MPARIHPAWFFGIPVLVLAAHVMTLVVPAVLREVIPAIVQAVAENL
jgi:hypothetical protein